MRLKLDENLPESLLGSLAALGHDVDNVRLQGIVGRDDPAVWQAAQSGSRFLITQDSTSLTSASSRPAHTMACFCCGCGFRAD
jgi:predicted nuclease of predicted toxin-antitoxin system